MVHQTYHYLLCKKLASRNPKQIKDGSNLKWHAKQSSSNASSRPPLYCIMQQIRKILNHNTHTQRDRAETERERKREGEKERRREGEKERRREGEKEKKRAHIRLIYKYEFKLIPLTEKGVL
jgi:flagellar biosynthesis/type III secretory pathway protein FliH